jgi:hypothetical protein
MKEHEMGIAHSTHGERKLCAKFWLQSLKGRDHLKDISADGSILLNWILRKWGWRVWSGFMCLKIGADGELL